jgi:hypothetical protein
MGRRYRREPGRADRPAVGDYLVALQTYRAAVKRWPNDKITLRNRARVIEQSWQD